MAAESMLERSDRVTRAVDGYHGKPGLTALARALLLRIADGGAPGPDDHAPMRALRSRGIVECGSDALTVPFGQRCAEYLRAKEARAA